MFVAIKEGDVPTSKRDALSPEESEEAKKSAFAAGRDEGDETDVQTDAQTDGQTDHFHSAESESEANQGSGLAAPSKPTDGEKKVYTEAERLEYRQKKKEQKKEKKRLLAEARKLADKQDESRSSSQSHKASNGKQRREYVVPTRVTEDSEVSLPVVEMSRPNTPVGGYTDSGWQMSPAMIARINQRRVGVVMCDAVEDTEGFYAGNMVLALAMMYYGVDGTMFHVPTREYRDALRFLAAVGRAQLEIGVNYRVMMCNGLCQHSLLKMAVSRSIMEGCAPMYLAKACYDKAKTQTSRTRLMTLAYTEGVYEKGKVRPIHSSGVMMQSRPKK